LTLDVVTALTVGAYAMGGLLLGSNYPLSGAKMASLGCGAGMPKVTEQRTAFNEQ